MHLQIKHQALRAVHDLYADRPACQKLVQVMLLEMIPHEGTNVQSHSLYVMVAGRESACGG